MLAGIDVVGRREASVEEVHVVIDLVLSCDRVRVEVDEVIQVCPDEQDDVNQQARLVSKSDPAFQLRELRYR